MMSGCDGGNACPFLVLPHCSLMLQTNPLVQLRQKDLYRNKIMIPAVKPVLKGHSKIDKTKILMTNGSLMKVESIAECS